MASVMSRTFPQRDTRISLRHAFRDARFLESVFTSRRLFLRRDEYHGPLRFDQREVPPGNMAAVTHSRANGVDLHFHACRGVASKLLLEIGLTDHRIIMLAEVATTVSIGEC